MHYQKLTAVALGLGLLAQTSPLRADDTTSGHSGLETMESSQVEQKLQINPGFTYISDADFSKDSLGKVNVWRFDVPARYTIKLGQGELGLGALYEYRNTTWTN